MATPVVTRRGQNTAQGSGQTTLATSAACTIPDNSLVVVVVTNCNAGNATVAPTAIDENSDGTGLFGSSPDVGQALHSNNGYVSIWSAYYVTGGNKTFRAKFASANWTCIEVYTISDMASTNWKDQIGAPNPYYGAVLDVTTNGNVAQADEVAFHAVCYGSVNNPSVWPEASPLAFTDGYPANYHNTTRSRSLIVQYFVGGLTAGQTLTATGSLAASQTVGKILVTYKAYVAAAPTNTTPPSLSGVEKAGEVITCDPGEWTNTPTSYAYDWEHDGGVGDWHSIGAADSDTYTLVRGDVTQNIRCKVTASNATGANDAWSSDIGPIAYATTGFNWRPVAGPDAQSDNTVHSTTLSAAVLPGERVVFLVGCSNSLVGPPKSDVGSVDDNSGHSYVWAMDEEIIGGSSLNSGQIWSILATEGMDYGDAISFYVDTGYHGQSPHWIVLALTTGDERTLSYDTSDSNTDYTGSPFHHVSPSISTNKDEAIIVGFHTLSFTTAGGEWTPDSGWELIISDPDSTYYTGETHYALAVEARKTDSGYTGTAGGNLTSQQRTQNLICAYSTDPASSPSDTDKFFSFL